MCVTSSACIEKPECFRFHVNQDIPDQWSSAGCGGRPAGCSLPRHAEAAALRGAMRHFSADPSLIELVQLSIDVFRGRGKRQGAAFEFGTTMSTQGAAGKAPRGRRHRAGQGSSAPYGRRPPSKPRSAEEEEEALPGAPPAPPSGLLTSAFRFGASLITKVSGEAITQPASLRPPL